MNYIEMLKALKAGKKITNKEWNPHKYVVIIPCSNDLGYIADENGIPTTIEKNLLINDGYSLDKTLDAILDDNWEIVEELHTFKEAFKALEEGKKISRKNYSSSYYLCDNRIVSTSIYGTKNHISFPEDYTLANDWIIEG